MKLYYFPIEQYPERASALMSCRDGWVETTLKEKGIDFVRIEGEQISDSVRSGNVLDAEGRCHYACTQTSNFIKNYYTDVNDGDVIYIEDFFHPSVESLFYIRHLTGKKFKIATFCYAQSVDDSDFTYPMRGWLRHIEIGFAKQYDYIFVCSPILKKLLLDNNVCNDAKNNIYVTGLPFNSKCLWRQIREMGGDRMLVDKEDFVLFSSRFDAEKDPMFFLDLVERCPDIKFKFVCPYSSRPPSRDKSVMDRLSFIMNRPSSNLEMVKTTNKVDYYKTLNRAKVQFNCAIQDWVSWTLIEASMFGCSPLYPIWKDFPMELNNDPRFLYKRRDINDCEDQLRFLMTGNARGSSFVCDKHNDTWNKHLKIMGFLK